MPAWLLLVPFGFIWIRGDSETHRRPRRPPAAVKIQIARVISAECHNEMRFDTRPETHSGNKWDAVLETAHKKFFK